MPVHVIVSQCGSGLSAPTECAWLEKFVTFDGYAFAFLDQPVTDQKLRKHLGKLPVRPAGYQTEVNLAALDWIDSASRKLDRGYALTIDYGHPRDEFFARHRSKGTLQVRAQHRLLQSPFDEIGDADITAHTEWTSIAERAEACGFEVKGFTDQHHFLTGIISEFAALAEDPKTKHALQTLLHPEMLGRKFQILALGKNVDLVAPLAGLKFAREPRSLLGLKRVAS
jgi:SAM-dependent MidA family methyltransferase